MPVYFNTFKTWKNKADTFVETGTLEGYGISKALEAGFTEIYSIEIDKSYQDIAKENFKTKEDWIKLAKGKKINFVLGDSSIVLENVMNKVSGKAVIWLDAHFGNINQYQFDHLPLMKELKILQKYSDKIQNILIDDIRCLQDRDEKFFPWSTQDLIVEIMKINPKFKITYDNGFTENDILSAYLEN